MTDGAQVEHEIGDALSNVLGQHGEYTNKWVVLVETIDAEGRRGLWTATSDDLTSWDSIGMLGYALQVEQARIVNDDAAG